jgi:RNA polymerase sigma-70 factor (ECF subfamily)
MQRELVERAQKGDHDAFAAIVAARVARLDGAARLILRDPDQAKDAVQETLLAAWRSLPTLRDPDLFDSWLHRLLVRACVDESRRLRRHRVDVPLGALDVATPADDARTFIDRDEIARGFRRLTTEQRALIVLHHYLALPLPEVAAAVGIPLGTAKSRLHRALAALRAALEADARTVVSPIGGRPA